jgi:hypothetical protein
MKIPRSLVSFQKVSSDKISWRIIDKNIFDEDVEITYTLRVFGLPIFIRTKVLTTRHTFDNEKLIGKISGFKADASK